MAAPAVRPGERPRRPGVGGALAALLALSAAGCGTVKSPTAPPDDGGGMAFTFSQIQAQIFTPTCAKAGCHVTGIAPLGLVLEPGQSFRNLVRVRAQGNPTLNRVEPGDPERSYLIKKLRGDPDIVGDRMPQDGPPFLTPEEVAGIAGWIRAGAPEN